MMSLVYDAATDRSELVVLAAGDIAAEPVARVHLPARVPVGFHGNWVPDQLALRLMPEAPPADVPITQLRRMSSLGGPRGGMHAGGSMVQPRALATALLGWARPRCWPL